MGSDSKNAFNLTSAFPIHLTEHHFKLHFSTCKLSEAQEKAKIKTPFSNSDLRDNFAKTKARILQKVSNRRHQNFDSELYGFKRVMKMIQCKKSILVGLIFYGNF